MTFLTSIRLAVAALALTSAVAAGESTATTKPPVATGCHHKGVAVHTFYGQAKDMQRYLGDLSAQAISSRLQVMVIETKQGAQVHLFEQAEGRQYNVSSWQGGTVANLRTEWDQKILASRGYSCAGADLKADLEQRGMPLVSKGTAEHVTATASFVPLLSEEAGFMRVSLYHPCD